MEEKELGRGAVAWVEGPTWEVVVVVEGGGQVEGYL